MSPYQPTASDTNPTTRARIIGDELLSDRKYTLRMLQLEWRRSDGRTETLHREVYDKGDGAVVLLYNRVRRSIILIRQFRTAAFVNGYPGLLWEAAAGGLDGMDPGERIRLETMEETGFTIDQPRAVFQAFMSPGAFTERLHFFVAEYDPDQRPGEGGGLADEGEDIEVAELPFGQAWEMLERGEIVDAKTIMLLQYARLHLFSDAF